MQRAASAGLFSLIGAFLSVAAGCSGGGSRLAGTATLDNKPLAHAEVQFIFDGGEMQVGGSTATATTDENGNFDVPVPEVKAGKYLVLVAKYVNKNGKVVTAPDMDEGLDFDQLLAAGELRNVLPPGYNDKDQRQLVIDLNAGANTGLQIKLVSAGK